MTSDGSGRRLAVTATLALAILLAGGCFWMWFENGPVPTSRVQQADRSSRAPSLQTQGPGTARTSGADPDEPADSGPAWRGPVARNGVASADHVGQGESTITIRYVDTAGKPMSNIEVRARVFSRPAPRDPAPFTREEVATTDSNGELKLTSGRAHLAALEVLDKRWHASRSNAAFLEQETVVITLSATATVRIRANYDDGQPVTHLGELYDRLSGYSLMFGLQNGGAAILQDVPVAGPLRCKIFGQKRPGYDNTEVEFSVAELTSGIELLVIVPKSTLTGGVRVEFLNGSFESGSAVMLEQEDGRPQSRTLGRPDTYFQWGGLPGGKNIRLTLIGELAWRSDWIAVAAGEVTTVTAMLRPGGGARARLLDGQGRPICGGVLRVSNGSYLMYTAARVPMVPSEFRSDGEGVVRVTGLPAQTLTLEAEAWGREVVARQCAIVAGGVTDLGDITLPDATGIIHVELTGTREGVHYHIVLMQPKGPPWFDAVPVDGAQCTVRGVPLRKYVVGVLPGKYGAVVSRPVELTASGSEQTLSIDVSSLAAPGRQGG